MTRPLAPAPRRPLLLLLMTLAGAAATLTTACSPTQSARSPNQGDSAQAGEPSSGAPARPGPQLMRAEDGETPITAAPAAAPRHRAPTDADYARRADALRKKLPGDFHVLVEKPFVVVGDELEVVVKARAERTVKWATTRLRKLYFSKDPGRIITVWLFKDRKSYLKHCAKFFDMPKPGTPFGFYSARHDALVMNIATGGGTLVHEMVHAFMERNFPPCPAWFNEGLASLYEQCGTKDGRIWGFTNWRLPGLQRAIRSGVVPSFKALTSTTTDEYYEEDPGTNYAQSRYLCYYLQEKKKLLRFWRAFTKNVERDPTGYRTLVDILGRTDMDNFKTEWEGYVLHLRR